MSMSTYRNLQAQAKSLSMERGHHPNQEVIMWYVLIIIPVIAFIIGFVGSLVQSSAKATTRAVMVDQFMDNPAMRTAILKALAHPSTPSTTTEE
jgi:hypothetical protein